MPFFEFFPYFCRREPFPFSLSVSLQVIHADFYLGNPLVQFFSVFRIKAQRTIGGLSPLSQGIHILYVPNQADLVIMAEITHLCKNIAVTEFFTHSVC